jgi:hypothetical protein
MPHDDPPQVYRGSQLELFGGEPAPPQLRFAFETELARLEATAQGTLARRA